MLKSKFLLLFITSLLHATVWLAVLRADPFGMSTAADRVSESVFLRLYPVMYPGAWREKVHVVMIDEAQLPLPVGEGASSEWPIRFEDHAALIKRLVGFKPKAVFVDVLFDTKKGRDPQVLADLIGELPSSSPVVFAAYRDAAKQAQIIEPLRALPYEGKRPALNGFVELTAPMNHYQLGDGEGRLSAAAAIYNATLDPAKLSERLTRETSDMLLAWGNTLSEANARFSECAAIVDAPESRWHALATAVQAGLERAFSDGAVDEKVSWERLQPCPYHSETAAREVFSAPPSVLAQRFEGAYVFVGAAISGSGDMVVSPVHGQLPGVYLHAMALDNLLTFKGAPLTTSGWAWLPQVVLVFLCTLAGAAVFGGRAAPPTRLSAAGELAGRFALWLGFAAVVSGLLLMFLVQFKWAPYNWGSVLAVAGVVFFAGAGKALTVLVRGGD